MRKYFWVGILIGGLGMGNAFSQSGLQLGFNCSIGRTFSQVDYTQANAENLVADPGPVVPVGVELAWIPSPHWRVGVGISLISYETRLQHFGLFTRDRGEMVTTVSIPVEVNYRIFSDAEKKKSFVAILGGSYNMIDQFSGRSFGSSGTTRAGEEIGSTESFTIETTTDFNISLRFGLGQEWRLGQKNRINLQFYALYNVGLSPIWNGEFQYWAERLPDGFNFDTPITDVLSEPLESYDSVSSNGSYITVGFKLYYNLIQE